MRTAVVFGAGGFGREAAAWYRQARPDSEFLGFLDEDATRHGRPAADYEVLGGLEWLDFHSVDDVILGVGAPATRRAISSALLERGISPTTLVHPTATIGERVSIGPGTIVCPGTIITVDVVVGHACLLNLNVTIGHDAWVGDYAVLAPGADIAGNVRIEPGADIGIGAAVLQGLAIGEGAIIGGGACVTRDIPERHVAVGTPAKSIKEHDRW